MALVVILVVLGFFLAITFLAREKPSESKKEFETSSLAANTINTILNTDTDCNGRNYKELIQECQTGRLICNVPNGTMASCKYAEEVAKQIFTNTIEKWGNDYVFKLSTTETEYFRILSTGLVQKGLIECPGNVQFQTQPIRSRTGATIFLSIAICT